MTFSICIHFQFQHHFLGDIIRNHSLCGALCSQSGQVKITGAFTDIIFFQNIDQFWECRCDIHAFFILNTFDPLTQRFFNDQSQVVTGSSFFNFIQVHEDRNKRSLTVRGHQCGHLILDRLDALFDLIANSLLYDLVQHFFCIFHADLIKLLFCFLIKFLTAYLHKRCQMGKRDALSAILIGCDLCDSLCSNIAGSGKALWTLNHGLGNNCTVLQHIFQIDQTAVMHMLCIIICIMEVNDAFFMSFHNIRRKKEPFCDVLADLASHIVTLYRVHDRILVGVFLFCFLIAAIQQRKDLFIRRVCLTGNSTSVTIGNIIARHIKSVLFHNMILDHILDLFHAWCTIHQRTFFCNRIHDQVDR